LAIDALHRYAFENYEPGPIAIAAARLVIEGLARRLTDYPASVERATTGSLRWLAQLRSLAGAK